MEPPHTPLRPAAGGHRDACVVAGGQHGGDLRGRGRAHDDAGTLRHGALGGPPDGERPPVAAGLGPGRVVGVHRGAGGREAVEQCGRDVDGGDPRRSATSSGAASIGVTGVGAVTAGRARPSGAPSGTTR